MAAAAMAAPTRANFMTPPPIPSPIPAHPCPGPRTSLDGRGGLARRGGDGARDEGPKRLAACRVERCRIIGVGDRGCKVRVCSMRPGVGRASVESSLPAPVRRQAPEPGPPDRQLPTRDPRRVASLYEVEPSAWSTWSARPASPTSTAWPLIGRRRAGGIRPRVARRRGPAPAAGLPAERERARRRDATGDRGRGASSSCVRRSLAGGYVGTVDFLVVAPDHDADRVTDALLEELLRSAGNKGCSTSWRRRALRTRDLARLERAGFAPAGPTLRRPDRGGPGSADQVMRRRAGADRRADVRDPAPDPNIGVNVGKNVAVFVDVANIFYAAKAAGVDIDYVTLLKSATAGRDFVRAYAYTGLDPDNENQRNFHQFLARHQYKVVSKDIRKYGDGKVKANLDIELVVDMMKTARNLDVAVIVSGDGDFAPAIRAVQEMGVRVEVISFRGNTSSDLIEVADLFTDITHIAKVDKGSTRVRPPRRGRRRGPVDDRGPRQGVRGHRPGSWPRSRPGPHRARSSEPVETVEPSRGRGRGRDARSPPSRVGRGGRRRGRRAAAPSWPCPARSCRRRAVRRSRRRGRGRRRAEERGRARSPATRRSTGEAPRSAAGRRRRGGRGRGRGRGRGPGAEEQAERGPTEAPPAAAARSSSTSRTSEDEERRRAGAARAPRPAAFGSVWDSQLGVPSAPRRGGLGRPDEEVDDEPAIPEYLLAERRRGAGAAQRPGQRGGRGGQRGRGGAYAAAIERERYGGARPRRPRAWPRLRAPAGGAPAGHGGGSRGGQRPSRAPQQAPSAIAIAPRAPAVAEPWSEVPPELEELLRAQMAQKTARQEAAPPARSEAAPPARPWRADAAGRARRGDRARPAPAPAAERPRRPPARTPRTRKARQPRHRRRPLRRPPPRHRRKAPARTSRTRKAAAARCGPGRGRSGARRRAGREGPGPHAADPEGSRPLAAPVDAAPAAEAPAKAPARAPRTRKAAPAEGA